MASPAHRRQRFGLGLLETGVIGGPCQRSLRRFSPHLFNPPCIFLVSRLQLEFCEYPRVIIFSLAAALGVYDAFNGLVPPNWGHPVPKRSGLGTTGTCLGGRMR